MPFKTGAKVGIGRQIDECLFLSMFSIKLAGHILLTGITIAENKGLAERSVKKIPARRLH